MPLTIFGVSRGGGGLGEAGRLGVRPLRDGWLAPEDGEGDRHPSDESEAGRYSAPFPRTRSRIWRQSEVALSIMNPNPSPEESCAPSMLSGHLFPLRGLNCTRYATRKSSAEKPSLLRSFRQFVAEGVPLSRKALARGTPRTIVCQNYGFKFADLFRSFRAFGLSGIARDFPPCAVDDRAFA